MRISSLMLVIILSMSYIPLPSAQAQVGVPDVNLECETGTIDIEVYPGASATGMVTCTVSNPNSYQEKISIQVTADGLAVAAPGSITLGPNAEEDFQVTVQAQERMAKQSRQMTVTATVTEAMGAPPPNIAEKEVTVIMNIKQFAGLQLGTTIPYVTIPSNNESIVTFEIINTGNWLDNFLVSITPNSRENLEDAGFKISLPVNKVVLDATPVPERVRVFFETPDDYSGWEQNSDGMYEATFVLEIEAKSEFSCNNGGCLTERVSVAITVLHEVETTGDIFSSAADNEMLIYGGGGAGLLLIILLVIVVKKRKS
ncbi:MAG: choice-of-anchor T family protein [Candidatus Poseidoniaceae archaeon]